MFACEGDIEEHFPQRLYEGNEVTEDFSAGAEFEGVGYAVELGNQSVISILLNLLLLLLFVLL